MALHQLCLATESSLMRLNKKCIFESFLADDGHFSEVQNKVLSESDHHGQFFAT